MKLYLQYSMTVIIAMMTACMFTACGDDKDDNLPEGYVKTTEGVHRIEVTIEGDLTGWEGEMSFVAVYGDGTHGKVKLFENGQMVSDDGIYSIETLRNCAIETDAKCDQMDMAMMIQHGSFKSVSSVTVTLRSFINGQPKKVKVVEFPASQSYKSIVFNSELDADIL